MVMLQDGDVQTKEVLSWEGLHLFHASRSTCSQKVRIFLKLKGLSWTSHHVDLLRKEQLEPYFMGINPRGLVPVLVHDGKVIIESNDILQYLEAAFPTPSLIPLDYANRVSELLREEDDLHLDIRALTMRFVLPLPLVRRADKDIAAYETSGSGTVSGKSDTNRLREAKFWRDLNTHKGIPDDRARQAFARFKAVLDDYENRLTRHEYLAGPDLSAVDIAWYIYCHRLSDTGYPLADLHPKLAAWFARIDAIADFHDEVPRGGIASGIIKLYHFWQKLTGTTLTAVVGPALAQGPSS